MSSGDEAAVDLTTVYRSAARLTLQKSLLLYIRLPSPLTQMEKKEALMFSPYIYHSQQMSLLHLFCYAASFILPHVQNRLSVSLPYNLKLWLTSTTDQQSTDKQQFSLKT